MNNFEVKSFSGPDPLARAAARDWLDLLSQSASAHLIAVSGGRIAKNFFSAVAELSKSSPASLGNVEFFWADERCVPPDHPDSNFLLAQQNLFQPLAIAPRRIHRLKGELDPSAAVAEANADLTRLAPKNKAGLPVIDVIFLGLGEDGHVASLMPNAPPAVLAATGPYLHIEKSPKPPPSRLSLSYAAIAAAGEVWMLASGSGKEEALRQSLNPGGTTPFARVLQSRSQTRIYTDINV